MTSNSIAQLRQRPVSRNDIVLHVPELCKVTGHYQAGIRGYAENPLMGLWADRISLGTAGIS